MTTVTLVHGLDDPVCGLAPLLDAARLVQPGLEFVRPLTLVGVTSLAQAEELWRDQIFVNILAPFLLDQLTLARLGRLRELVEQDLAFSKHLPSELAAASVGAGRRLASQAGAMRGDRLLPKLADRVAAATMPGHYLTIFAARSAAFAMDDRTTVGASVVREVCGWSINAPAPAVAGFVRSCISVIPASRYNLRAA